MIPISKVIGDDYPDWGAILHITNLELRQIAIKHGYALAMTRFHIVQPKKLIAVAELVK